MQALILAAGRGSRLGAKGASTPKCLLEVDRQPLVEHQLKALAEAGIAPVAMVVGYCADEIKEEVKIRAEYIHNERWKSTNSLYSFWLARDWVKDSVFVLNSDTLFAPEILNRLLDAQGDAIAYDSRSGDAREHMKVQVREGRLVDMSKDLDQGVVSGENVGILKFTGATVRELFEIAEELIGSGHETAWLGAAVRRLAQRRHVNALDIAGLPWGEVDSAYDLQHLRKTVAPAIRSRSSRLGPRYRSALAGTVGLSAVGLPAYLLLGSSWVTPPAGGTWETIELRNAVVLPIQSEGHVQSWSLLEDVARTAEGTVMGPGRISVDSRVIAPQGGLTKIPYVLEIRMDGELVDWFQQTASPSGTWQQAGHAVGQRTRLQLALGPGPHTVGVKLAAAQSGRCLVRLLRLADEEED